MPLQNRVTPFNEIIAHPSRECRFMGNRGKLHDEDRQLGRARWKGDRWIICVLDFRGRWNPVMGDGYTRLFFLDEVTALAAGHRPCAECRHEAFNRYVAAWRTANRKPGARIGEIDKHLHAERVERATKRQITYQEVIDDLPDGTFIAVPGWPRQAILICGDGLFPWSLRGYGIPHARSSGVYVNVLTPRSTVAVLAAGYRPYLHPRIDSPVTIQAGAKEK